MGGHAEATGSIDAKEAKVDVQVFLTQVLEKPGMAECREVLENTTLRDKFPGWEYKAKGKQEKFGPWMEGLKKYLESHNKSEAALTTALKEYLNDQIATEKEKAEAAKDKDPDYYKVAVARYQLIEKMISTLQGGDIEATGANPADKKEAAPGSINSLEDPNFLQGFLYRAKLQVKAAIDYVLGGVVFGEDKGVHLQAYKDYRTGVVEKRRKAREEKKAKREAARARVRAIKGAQIAKKKPASVETQAETVPTSPGGAPLPSADMSPASPAETELASYVPPAETELQAYTPSSQTEQPAPSPEAAAASVKSAANDVIEEPKRGHGIPPGNTPWKPGKIGPLPQVGDGDSGFNISVPNRSERRAPPPSAN